MVENIRYKINKMFENYLVFEFFAVVNISIVILGLWCRVALYVVTNVSKKCIASIFRTKHLQDNSEDHAREFKSYGKT
jgi:hypothetical protein